MQNIKGTEIREIVQNALKNNIKKYQNKAEKFEIYLCNLEQNQLLDHFIKDLSDNAENLKITKQDILDLLGSLGEVKNLKDRYGLVYFQLWFQFYLVEELNIKGRLDENKLKLFPVQKEKQLQVIKGICLQKMSNKTEGLEKKILQKLQNNKLFKQYIEQKKNLKERVKPLEEYNVKKSKLSLVSSKKQPILFMIMLQKILQKMGNAKQTIDYQEKRQELKEFFDIILQNQSLQKQILTFNLKEVILNILNIEIKSSIANLLPLSKQIIKESFQFFRSFYSIQDLSIRLQKGQIQFNKLFQFFSKLLYDKYRSVWYWPNYNNKSLINLIFRYIMPKKQMHLLLIEKLNQYEPTLQSRIWNADNRTFLIEVLLTLRQFQQKGNFLKCFEKLILSQNIPIEQQLYIGESYYKILLDLGMPATKLQQISLIDINGNYQFYIFCDNDKKKRSIYLTKEHANDLIDKIKNKKNYSKEKFENIKYQFKFTANDRQYTGVYKSGDKGGYKKSQIFEGILNYSKIMEFGNQIKSFSWKILEQQKWKYHDLTRNQCQKISSQMVSAFKSKEKDAKFKLKLLNQELHIEINCETLQVKQLVREQVLKQSLVMKKFGFLVFFPSHKSKNRQNDDNEGILQQVEDPYPSFQDDDNKKIKLDHQKMQSFEQKFQSLGIFQQFFIIEQDYKIDQQKNVICSKPIACQYFKKWQQITLYDKIIQSLDVNMNVNSKRQVGNNFKTNKKLYGGIVTEFNILSARIKKNIIMRYDQKNEEIIIDNLKDQLQSKDVFKCVLQYYTLKISHNADKKTYIMQFSKEDINYIKQAKPNGINIVNHENKVLQFQANKEEKEKLLKEVQSLDQIQEFTYQHPDAYEVMKKQDPQYIKNIKLVEVQVGPETFRVRFRLRDHPEFKKRLKIFYDMIQEKPGQKKQKTIKQHAQFINIYRSQLEKYSDDINVSKLGTDILIQYNSKLQKSLQKILVSIKEAIDRQYFQILQKTSNEHEFKNIQQDLIFILKDKLSKILLQHAKMNTKPHIDVTISKDKGYIMKASSISAEQQTLFNNNIHKFNQKYKDYMKYKQKINNMESLRTKQLNKLPKDKYNGFFNNMIINFKDIFSKKILSVINEIIKNKLQKIQAQFRNYVQNVDFNSSFTSNIDKQSIKEIQTKLKEINIFNDYIEEFIKKTMQQTKQQRPASVKQILLKQINQIVKVMEEKYNKNQLKKVDMQKYFKSLMTLTKIYYGQQLPITEHLQKFKQLLQKNDVVMVKVGTGSGKSTVIPPYLVGLGYNKVVVTQPRRLPCRQIYKRINQVFGKGVSGYEVAEESQDTNNSLIYMTDGLLKMRAIFKLQEVFDKIDVLVIDQIHERSANIDILLLLLNMYFKSGKKKLKLVLCSATIDQNIGFLMKDAGLSVNKFQVKTNRYEVKQFPIEKGNIIQKIVQLSQNLKNDQQILVFYPGISEVLSTVQILQTKYNRQAYPIMSNQNPKDQQRFLNQGQIFISTAIAETSLTFKKLKYVIDSRLSRSRKFNPQIQLMQTQETYSSNSSIQQRKGRLGRTCPGEYYYFVYNSYDFQGNREYNPTQLQNIDFTSNIFELLLVKELSFNSAANLIGKLKHPMDQFEKKKQYSLKILQDLGILNSNGTLIKGANNLMIFGNLGNPQHNSALYEAKEKGCLLNMIYIVSFLMIASNASGAILKYLKSLHKGGDIKIIHDFISSIAQKINLRVIDNRQILNSMKKNCPNIVQKPWFKMIFRVICKVKNLLKTCTNNVISTNWNDVIDVFRFTYRNKIFFNQSNFGGNKNTFQKIRNGYTFNFEEKHSNQSQKINYKMDMNSAIYNKDNLPKTIISLNCSISPEGQCILSICQQIDPSKIKQEIKINIKGSICQQKYFTTVKPLKEVEIMDKIQIEIRSNFNALKVVQQKAEMKMVLFGRFNDVAKGFNSTIQPLRRNKQLKINLKTILQQAIQARKQRVLKDNLLPPIQPEYTRHMLQKLNNNDFKNMFQTMKFQLLNNYGVEVQWQAKSVEVNVILKNIKNVHINIVLNKLKNFARWFSDSQLICKQEHKIRPQYIQQSKYLTDQARTKVMQRVNQIVDSRIQHYVIKSWANGRGPSQHPRTSRMIAVCWVLTNIFDCVVKGGFIRDWVVNSQEKVPKGNLSNLLQINPRNGYKQVIDDTVTPSDIDAELSHYKLFEEQKFLKEMKKMGIQAKIQEDGWRKHIIFDDGMKTGGFTADLIQPYTSMCHDTYDFDVNTMYLKKDHLNSIGQKIPLEFIENKRIKIQLEELLSTCRKKQMKPLKRNIWQYRFDKFKSKGWKIIENDVFMPVIYRSYFTQASMLKPDQIGKISPIFVQNMGNVKVHRIQALRNQAWDDAFEFIEHWIVTQIQKTNKANNLKTNVNSNSKILFHGSSEVGVKGIKDNGFDSRFYNSTGKFGRGAYFADNPVLSHGYTSLNSQGFRQMFIVKVALGNQQVLIAQHNTKLGPSKGFHSIHGKLPNNPQQFIVQRWGQAKPLYLITYA